MGVVELICNFIDYFKCRATLPPSLQSCPEAVAMAPYLWTLQFTHLSPGTCFVLDDGTGRAVGYCIGVADVFRFAEEYPRYVREVLQSEQGIRDVPPPRQLDTLESWVKMVDNEDENGNGNVSGSGSGRRQVNPECLAQTAYKVEWLVLQGVEGKKELVERYRAMMHIDLLEGWQGKGWGKKMIDEFVRSVKSEADQGRADVGKGIQIGVAGENTKVVGFYEKVGFRVYPGGEREGNVWMVRDL